MWLTEGIVAREGVRHGATQSFNSFLMPLRDNRPPLPPFCGHSRFQNCSVPHSSAATVDEEWRLLRGFNSGCLGSFVSLLTTDAYVEAALCLHTQLRLLKSTCPLVLVYDDAYLSATALSRLQQSFAARFMLCVRKPKFRFRYRHYHVVALINSLPSPPIIKIIPPGGAPSLSSPGC